MTDQSLKLLGLLAGGPLTLRPDNRASVARAAACDGLRELAAAARDLIGRGLICIDAHPDGGPILTASPLGLRRFLSLGRPRRGG